MNNDEIVVDLFAGGGGASDGIELALGRPVTLAVNHSRTAIECHQRNHPHTHHEIADVWLGLAMDEAQGWVSTLPGLP